MTITISRDVAGDGPPCEKCGRPMTWYWWAPGACEYLCDYCLVQPKR